MLEYQFDNRNAIILEEDSHNPISNLKQKKKNIFSGFRLTFNDAQDTEFLAGVILDNKQTATSYFIETKRRISNNWKIEFDARIFASKEQEIYKDDFVRLQLARYF